MPARVAVILPAAGSSTRFGGREKKPFLSLDGRAIWYRCAELFLLRPDVIQVILVVSGDDMEMVRGRFGPSLIFHNIRLVQGGSERFESIANALAVVSGEADLIAVHDAVRPLCTASLIDAVFAKAAECGAALPAVPVTDTLKRVGNDDTIEATVPRERLYAVQTPQVFRRDLLIDAYARRGEYPGSITDDATLVEWAGKVAVSVTPGHPTNLKITTPDDLRMAELILKDRQNRNPQRASRPFADDEFD